MCVAIQGKIWMLRLNCGRKTSYLGDSTQPQQKYAGTGENGNFVIAVNFYPVL